MCVRAALVLVLVPALSACARAPKVPIDEATFTVDPTLHPPPSPPEPITRTWPKAPPPTPELRKAAGPNRHGRYHAPPFGPRTDSPWIGRTSMDIMEWRSGCTGVRVRRTVSIELEGVHYPLAHLDGDEPLFDPNELPRAPCSRVIGRPFELGHEGYIGSPVYAIAVESIEDARCPTP